MPASAPRSDLPPDQRPARSPARLPRVTILMACYQGAAHLPAQLASIAAQSGVDWALWASDDGSFDDTRAILRAFQAAHPGRVRLLDGPREGAAAHFLALLCHPSLPNTPIALADQDDIWYPFKLKQALSHLKQADVPPDTPIIYSARSRHVDATGTPLGLSRRFHGPASFGNAQVENRISGHAAVLNQAAVALVCAAGPAQVPFHDWWLYLLVTGTGGQVICDPMVVLDYRQHDGNLLGAPRGWRAQLSRIAQVLGRGGTDMLRANRTALHQISALLTPEARTLLHHLDTAASRGPARPRQLARLGIRRSQRSAQTLLHVAALLGRA